MLVRIPNMEDPSQVSINKNFKCKIVNIFKPLNFSISFGCSKDSSH